MTMSKWIVNLAIFIKFSGLSWVCWLLLCIDIQTQDNFSVWAWQLCVSLYMLMCVNISAHMSMCTGYNVHREGIWFFGSQCGLCSESDMSSRLPSVLLRCSHFFSQLNPFHLKLWYCNWGILTIWGCWWMYLGWRSFYLDMEHLLKIC